MDKFILKRGTKTTDQTGRQQPIPDKLHPLPKKPSTKTTSWKTRSQSEMMECASEAPSGVDTPSHFLLILAQGQIWIHQTYKLPW